MSFLKGDDNYYSEVDDAGSTQLVGYPDMKMSLWFMVACVGVAAFLMLFFNTNYKRLEVSADHPDAFPLLPVGLLPALELVRTRTYACMCV